MQSYGHLQRFFSQIWKKKKKWLLSILHLIWDPQGTFVLPSTACTQSDLTYFEYGESRGAFVLLKKSVRIALNSLQLGGTHFSRNLPLQAYVRLVKALECVSQSSILL